MVTIRKKQKVNTTMSEKLTWVYGISNNLNTHPLLYFTLCNGLNQYHAALPTYNYKQTTDIEIATNNIRKR